MVRAIKDIVNKASGVFGRNNGPGKRYWPAGVLNQLETRYHLRPEEMLQLGYLRHRMTGKNKGLYSLYIYDRLAARERHMPVRNVKDIYKSVDLLRFRGSMTGDGSVHVGRVDRFTNN
jgi:hypothetical protein